MWLGKAAEQWVASVRPCSDWSAAVGTGSQGTAIYLAGGNVVAGMACTGLERSGFQGHGEAVEQCFDRPGIGCCGATGQPCCATTSRRTVRHVMSRQPVQAMSRRGRASPGRACRGSRTMPWESASRPLCRGLESSDWVGQRNAGLGPEWLGSHGGERNRMVTLVRVGLLRPG